MPEPLVKTIGVAPSARAADQPERFHQRFGAHGEILGPDWPRLTSEETAARFEPRSEGLRILLINPPIREGSYPNTLPTGQAYVGSVAAMDGHHLSVLDLNAERRQPVKDAPE